VHLASHALKRGYQASIYTYNLQLFDPSWFQGKNISIKEKLKLQRQYKKGAKLKLASKAYEEFLNLGGELLFETLNANLIRSFLKKSTPIITGLSATYLYDALREIPETNQEDDLQGLPVGHFVVICGYEPRKKRVIIADPYSSQLSKGQKYKVSFDRLVGAIFLGILTYDANLLVIEPRKEKRQ
ncbi:MAG: hypothetical protein KDK66_05810, partial [Deltaproteobacteria bacterium]|nr:hypothetical protein [Deltaproteobacteria bacterium]